MTTHRVILCGAGVMGRVHADVYAQIPSASVADVVDPYLPGQALAAELGVPHFPELSAALSVIRSLDPNGTGQTRWTTRWKPALNAFTITFADRMPAAEGH